MKKVTAYRCPNGVLETDPLRAFAWKLSHLSKHQREFSNPSEKIDFNSALWLLENKDVVKNLIAEYESETK